MVHDGAGNWERDGTAREQPGLRGGLIFPAVIVGMGDGGTEK